MNDKRPDPDALLSRVKADEQKRSRGKLKVFFGASPGVGKTYAMLEAAQAKKSQGLDTVIGIVETHGRGETAALLKGLEILPTLTVDYHGSRLREFDLDAALKRKPHLILIDELAHTNVEGSRHPKRWQDVLELLDSGIDVYTTLNVQHLESLNDIVAQITGVVVRETLPDSVLEQADEVELVDLPPDDLLKRLEEGKVYAPEQAKRAVKNFFRKGNLTALREIALRRTADRVNDQVQDYRKDQSITQTWATSERIMVCVGPSPASASLVRTAHRMAKSLKAEWIAVTVETPSPSNLSKESRDRAIQHLRLAEQLGAETATLTGQNFGEEVVNYARERNVTKIFIGRPLVPLWRRVFFPSPVDSLFRMGGDIDIYVTRGASDKDAKPAPPPFSSASLNWPGYGVALGGVLASTAVAWLLYPHVDLANLIMVYLLGVLAVASRVGLWPSTWASFLSVIAFDFFFVPPRFSFAVSDTQYIFMFLVMLLVGLSISNLTVRVRRQAKLSRLRERRTAALYALSRELAGNRGTQELLGIAVKHIAEVFESDVIALLPDPQGRLKVQCGTSQTFALSPKEMGVAHWSYDLGQVAGRGTDTLPASEALYVPLLASGEPVGALGVKPKDPERLFIPEQLHLLEAFAHQSALAVAGDRMEQKQKQTQVLMETEKLRSSLLSSVSHDLRTPLAAIAGSASSLLENRENMDKKTQDELLENIFGESERLNRLVNNLLEMTRLESGAIRAKKEKIHINEIIGSALGRLEKQIGSRTVEIRARQDLPAVPMDGLLIEQVLVNLLDNALKYTPDDSPVELSADREGAWMNIKVFDRGPGLTEDDLAHVFDKFYRGQAQRLAGGTGLGLSVCKGILDLHEGKIEAFNRPGGGAVFQFSLPMEPKP
jgi:two-component system sensor histidine kinase KdpD